MSVRLALWVCCLSQSAVPPESPRVTRVVKVIQQVESSVVAIFSQGDNGRLNSGSGSVIHRDGFILTADHVVRDYPGVVLLKGQTPQRYRLVGRLPEKDLAVIQIRPTHELTHIPLGRSHDLMTGEPILVGGNPAGRGIVFTSGIVSSPSFMIDAPNALVMAHFRNDVRDRYIQFDAASNQGNSGGPLVNIEGQQVGVVSRKSLDQENISFAIPIDRVRGYFPTMISPEIRGGFVVGLDLDILRDEARVTAVKPEFPAATAGLKSGDALLSADGKPLRNAIDWILQLAFRKPGDEIAVTFSREGNLRKCKLVLADYPLAEPVSKDRKKTGIRCALYEGTHTSLPDFSTLTPARQVVTQNIQAEPPSGDPKDNYALVYRGYLAIPQTGVYRLVLASDDGSRLFVRDKLVIDNDGLHPRQEVGCLVRLAAGLHPIRVEYFEATGDAELELQIEGVGSETLTLQRVPANMLFYDDSQ